MKNIKINHGHTNNSNAFVIFNLGINNIPYINDNNALMAISKTYFFINRNINPQQSEF